MLWSPLQLTYSLILERCWHAYTPCRQRLPLPASVDLSPFIWQLICRRLPFSVIASCNCLVRVKIAVPEVCE